MYPFPSSGSALSWKNAATANDLRNRFSEQYPKAHFVKIDVDEVPDVAQELSIRAMPTFIVFKDGQKVEEVVGANPKALETAISTYALE
jgi:thioredoxin 1